MLRGIIGDTGGGKTLTMVKTLIRTLLETERFCCTNLQELNLPRLNEYLQEEQARLMKKHPARRYRPINLDDRLRVIDKLDTKWFYRFRANGLVLPPFSEHGKDGKKLPLDEFNQRIEEYFRPLAGQPGVEYFMSECHRFFPAREFMNFARSMGFYSTQHRHFDDNAWLETQFPMQIDSNFRELIVEWYHIRNQYRESFGMFKKPGRFIWRMYYDLPKGRKEMDGPDDKGEFVLDVAGVASCYKTRGAVNSAMADATAEEKPKSKKLPFWVLPVGVIVGIVVVGVIVAFIPKLAEKGVGAFIGGVSKGAKSTIPEPPKAVPVDTSKTEVFEEVSQNPPLRTVTEARLPDRSQVRVRGYVRKGNQVLVMLTDGRTITHREFQDGDWLRSDSVRVGGERFFYVQPEARSASRSAPAQPAIPAQTAAENANPLPSPPPPPESSWETASDGVSRLKKTETIAELFAR